MHVWIPWRPAESRMPAFTYCTAWWQEHGANVRTIDAGGEPFSLAASRNLAVDIHAIEHGEDEPLLIADADTVGDWPALTTAIDRVQDLGVTILPYTDYHSLGDAGTPQALAGRPLHLCEHFSYPPAVSGLYVTTPRIWRAYGGQDPRFRGWLGEDLAHLHAHETLLGLIERVPGTAYALGHDSEPKQGPQFEANRKLMHRYAAARGDRVAMLELIAER